MDNHWKNPYQAKRGQREIKKVKANVSASATPIDLSKSAYPQELSSLMNNFKDGVKGISSSVQQFEKTMESLSELYQTFDQLGGIKRLNQILSSTNASRGASSQTIGVPFQHLRTFLNLLNKVDFQQINQFLSSPIIQGMFPIDESKKE